MNWEVLAYRYWLFSKFVSRQVSPDGTLMVGFWWGVLGGVFLVGCFWWGVLGVCCAGQTLQELQLVLHCADLAGMCRYKLTVVHDFWLEFDLCYNTRVYLVAPHLKLEVFLCIRVCVCVCVCVCVLWLSTYI